MRTEGFNDRLVLVGLESLDDDLHGSVNGAMKRAARTHLFDEHENWQNLHNKRHTIPESGQIGKSRKFKI